MKTACNSRTVTTFNIGEVIGDRSTDRLFLYDEALLSIMFTNTWLNVSNTRELGRMNGVKTVWPSLCITTDTGK